MFIVGDIEKWRALSRRTRINHVRYLMLLKEQMKVKSSEDANKAELAFMSFADSASSREPT